MNTFVINFLGLCAYVRRANNREASVLLANHHHEPHIPILTVYLDSLVGGKQPELFKRVDEEHPEFLEPEGTLRQPSYAGALGQLEISDYEVRILPGGESADAPGLDFMNLGKTKTGCPSPNGSDSGDVGWFADLNVLSKKKADPAVLSGDLIPHRVKTRVLLSQGTFACLSQARDHGTMYKFHFGNPSDARALGDAAGCRLDTVHETVVLELRKKVQHSSKKDLNIELRLPTMAWITNLPPKAAIGALSHFDAFNGVLTQPANLPKPQQVDPCPVARTASERPIPCPQGMLQ
jgi:hypothetical protein